MFLIKFLAILTFMYFVRTCSRDQKLSETDENQISDPKSYLAP